MQQLYVDDTFADLHEAAVMLAFGTDLAYRQVVEQIRLFSIVKHSMFIVKLGYLNLLKYPKLDGHGQFEGENFVLSSGSGVQVIFDNHQASSRKTLTANAFVTDNIWKIPCYAVLNFHEADTSYLHQMAINMTQARQRTHEDDKKNDLRVQMICSPNEVVYQRTMRGIQKLMLAANSARYSKTLENQVHEYSKQEHRDPLERILGADAVKHLSLSGTTFYWTKDQTKAFEASRSMAGGGIQLVRGPSGGGKTAFLALMVNTTYKHGGYCLITGPTNESVNIAIKEAKTLFPALDILKIQASHRDISIRDFTALQMNDDLIFEDWQELQDWDDAAQDIEIHSKVLKEGAENGVTE